MSTILNRLAGMTLFLAMMASASQAAVDRVESNKFYDPGWSAPTTFMPGSSRVPILAGMTQQLTAWGDWLDITNKAELLIGGNTVVLTYSTGKLDGKPYVKVNIPSLSTMGRATVRLSRPGGSDDLLLRVVPDVKVTAVTPISTRTNNIALENAFKVNTDFIIRLDGNNVDQVDGVKFGASNSFTNVRINGTPTVARKEFLVQCTQVTDLANINERNLSIVYPDVRSLGYDEFETHRNNSAPFNFFRIYDKASFELADVGNKFVRGNGNGCGSLIDTTRTSLSGNAPLVNGAQAITQFRLVNPTAAQPQINSIVAWPDINVTIRNTSFAPVPSFQAQIKFGLNLVATVTVPAMLAKGTAKISFRRAVENRKWLARHVNCNDVYEMIVAPFDWVDPTFTIVLDPANTVPKTGPSQFNF